MQVEFFYFLNIYYNMFYSVSFYDAEKESLQ